MVEGNRLPYPLFSVRGHSFNHAFSRTDNFESDAPTVRARAGTAAGSGAEGTAAATSCSAPRASNTSATTTHTFAPGRRSG